MAAWVSASHRHDCLFSKKHQVLKSRHRETWAGSVLNGWIVSLWLAAVGTGNIVELVLASAALVIILRSGRGNLKPTGQSVSISKPLSFQLSFKKLFSEVCLKPWENCGSSLLLIPNPNCNSSSLHLSLILLKHTKLGQKLELVYTELGVWGSFIIYSWILKLVYYLFSLVETREDMSQGVLERIYYRVSSEAGGY